MIESKEQEIARAKDLMERKETMAQMLKPLSKEKAEVMSQLLESVQTAKLKSAYDKYLPAVMDDKPVAQAKKIISEAKGDKADVRQTRDDADINSIRKLAGI